jgi:hypothetical protein
MLFKSFLAVMLVMPGVPAAPADEIKIAQPRPMMILSDELTRRYGYLVTYEDAPADPAREIVTETRANGRQFRYPAWSGVTFHVEARKPTELQLAPSSASPQTKPEAQQAPPVAVLGPELMDPLIKEYNSSGNPGRFSVIYGGDYAHIVQDGRTVNGKIVEFQPILSTVVPVNLQEGTCWDLVKNLFDEVQQARKIAIVNAFPPVNQWDTRTCSISGHDLPARQVLTKLLDQIAVRPGISPDDRFLWTLVHDPNENAYFFGTQVAPRPAEAATTPEKAQPQAQTPATASKTFKPGATPPPVKKN